jgi:hypothetical protein
MLARLRSGLTFANVVSLIALFVALSGGAYALSSIPKDSVGARQLKKSAVTGSKIKNGAVTSSKVKDHSLVAKDFKAQQLPGASPGQPGPPGPQGPQGAKGDTGVVGAGTRQVGNVNGIACNNPVVVGSMPLTVPANSQIWTYGQGAIAVRSSDITEAGLFLRLRDAADKTTLAVSVAQWQGHLAMQDVSPLSTGGLMLIGDDPDNLADPFTAAPGTYILQLMAWPNEGTCAAKPDFGWNQGGVMGYTLLRQG